MNKELKNIILALLPVLVIGGIFYLGTANRDIHPVQPGRSINSTRCCYPYIKMLDTVHFLGDEYIEINLNEQKAILHRRDDSSLVYKISTGTDRISKGIKTPPGLFTIQTKLEVAVSKQFNNAKLFYWLGFNGNIGFHGLRTSGYYAHLGKRPSSHGCIRIGRDKGKDLYGRVRKGTPVIVHNERPALELVFSTVDDFDANEDLLLFRKSKTNNYIIRGRLQNLYKGQALRYNRGRLFLDGRTVMKPYGVVIGRYDKVPERQMIPIKRDFINTRSDNLFIYSFIADSS